MDHSKFSDTDLSMSNRTPRAGWTATLVAALLMAGSLYIWKQYLSWKDNSLINKVELNGAYGADQVQRALRDNVRELENLAYRIEMTDGSYFQHWQRDAQLLLRQNPSFQFIEWIDSSMVIREILPEAPNQAAIGLNIAEVDYRRAEWLRHKADSTTNLTEWADMTQGGKAFLVDIPLHYSGRFWGSITGGMDFKPVFDKMFSNKLRFSVILKDELGTVFYQSNQPALQAIDEKFVYQAEILIDPSDDQTWQFYFMPTAAEIARVAPQSKVIFTLGLLMSLLLGVLTYYGLRTREISFRLKGFNAQLRKTNRQLHKERERVQKASAAKSDFLSTMSHEIRTPLNAILGFIHLLEQKEENQESLEYLNMMDLASKNLLALINDILEIDKIESGEIRFRDEAFNPEAQLQELKRLFNHSFEEKGLSLRLEGSFGEQTNVFGDKTKFNQILINLLRNALKFTEEGGVQLLYRAEEEAGKLVMTIDIIDSGIGIPKAFQERIFERFSQADGGYSRKHEGSGLGLSIVANLLKMMKGSISVESEEGQGAHFTVRLSLPIVSSETDDQQPQSGQTNSFEGKKVLVVEDNPMNVMVLQRSLENMKVKVSVANNGVEAVKMAEEAEYDLIFMDLHMPEMDGITATEALRDNGNTTPIVALSANVTKEAIDEALAAGMQDYLTKPFTRERLLEALQSFALS